MRAAANGEAFMGRLGSTKISNAENSGGRSVKASMAGKPATAAAPKPKVAAAPPRPQPMKVPAHVEARGQAYADAFRSGFARASSQMARLWGHAAVQGRYGSAMMLVTEGMTDDAIIARLPNTLTDRQRATDRVWERAMAAVYRPGRAAGAADERKQTGKAGDRNSADVWDRARASIDGNRATSAADLKPAASAKSGSADDIWTRAYAAVAR